MKDSRIIGKIYRHRKYGRYTYKLIENAQRGDKLDWGFFDGFSPKRPEQGENTHNVRFAHGNHYTETKGAKVRIWLDEG